MKYNPALLSVPHWPSPDLVKRSYRSYWVTLISILTLTGIIYTPVVPSQREANEDDTPNVPFYQCGCFLRV
jgi:hypothetical protein